ncbi:MAG: HAMP domain-containing histidine kinase [Saprospiraceae bacterium]|nr:HAMP domain-containing histidine kinase [Saprospiraceae bacterium]
MSSFKIKILVFLGFLLILGVFITQGLYIFKNYNKEEAEFHRSVSIALRNTANEIAKYNEVKLPDKDLIKRDSSHVYEVNVNSPIDQTILVYYLETELDKQGISTIFEYGIYDCNTNELIISECCISTKENEAPLASKKKKVKKVKKKQTYYFVVRFPEKEALLLKEMKPLVLSSALVFIACLIFTLAIFVILRQKRYSELMRDFINNMTHEFKTPISSIKIASDVISHHPLIEEDKRLSQYAKIIRDQNLRLNDQVEKVLQIAKMESSTFQLKKELVGVNDLIRQISSQYAFRLGDEGGSLEIHLDAKNDKIKVDKFHFTNIISNLMDNAVKYSKKIPEISIFTRNTDAQTLEIEIRDKGVGIPPEDQDKLFQKFYRVSTGDVHNVKGFGIGLYYVKRICEAHGFDLNLHSIYGEGTSVFINCKTDI